MKESQTVSQAIRYILLIASVFWVISLTEWMWEQSWSHWVGYPRSKEGIIGIFLGAWLHGDWIHLGSNTVAFVMLGSGLFILYPALSEKVLWINFFLTGFGVWLFARSAYHIGASGWIYSLASFLFFSGIFRRDRRSLLISLTIMFVYAGMLETIFPSEKTNLEHISWESHLVGGIVGAFMAFSFRKEIADSSILEENEETNYANINYQEGIIPLETSTFVYSYKETKK
ncbi:putative membrane protein [Bernardetia litoralis DSM 6794]|uniref:Putative membrane protein n=1 Tax=Bernardetia litoralis (strain ATCC 23117 / DSM 6794 / NBRC 15988 / NCIMB 1366 / Fx l1 / Sio-4) TaxID=880071 RepID=I4AGL1_BERLS|nr:rhomboid family intramembrane serine protease [Bernardetia litoralis]AFM03096.1 putative membrane protein [Bernardetia litoralis DSM 6794]